MNLVSELEYYRTAFIMSILLRIAAMMIRVRLLLVLLSGICAQSCFAQSAGERLNAAMMMMAVISFADECPDMEPDLAFARVALNGLNVSVEDMRDDKINFARIVAMTDVMKERKDANCRHVWEQFGPEGAGLRGLVRKRQ